MNVSKKKIKLFIDAHTFDKEFQGTRTFIKELYRELAKDDSFFEFYIAACNIDRLKKEFDFLPDAIFIRYKFSSSMVRLMFEIPLLLIRFKIELSHFQYILPFWGRGKYIVTTHDILFNDFKSEFSFLYRFSRNFLFRWSIKKAHYKSTVSNYSRARIAFHYKINSNAIAVIPNGVNEIYFEDFDPQTVQRLLKEKFNLQKYILYVSRIEPRKNNVALLRAFLNLNLHTKGFTLVFVGKTSIESPDFLSALQQLNTQQKPFVKHFEQLSEEELILFYRGMSLFVYPSKAEGFGIPPLEAAAIGVPVLCSNKTAMADYSFFEERLFDPYDQKHLEIKMQQVFDDNNLGLTDKIKNLVRIKYSWQASAKAFVKMLDR